MSVKDQFTQMADSHKRHVENIREESRRVKLPDDIQSWLVEVYAECALVWNKLPPDIEPAYRADMIRHIEKVRELSSGENVDELKFYVYLVYTNLKRMQDNVSIYRDVKKTDGADTGRKKSKEKREKKRELRLERVEELYIEAEGRPEPNKADYIAKKMKLTPTTIRNYLDDLELRKKKTKKS